MRTSRYGGVVDFKKITDNSSFYLNIGYEGVAYTYTTVFEMSWKFLILPLILVIVLALFLLASIMQTAFAKVKAWKDDPLPLLFANVDQGITEQYSGLKRGVLDKV